MRLHKERSNCLYGVTETSMMSKLRFGRTCSISPTAAHSNGTEHFATSSIRNSPHHTGSRKLLFRRRRGRLSVHTCSLACMFAQASCTHVPRRACPHVARARVFFGVRVSTTLVHACSPACKPARGTCTHAERCAGVHA